MSEKNCPVCGGEVRRQEFDGDWEILSCTSEDCDTKIESPVGENPGHDGFTMESLKNVSDYVQ